MKLRWTSHFARAYAKAPEEIQTAFGKQSLLLLQNLRRPSLHSKKYDEGRGRWQARVSLEMSVDILAVTDAAHAGR